MEKEKPGIPRLALDDFAGINYKVPLLSVEQYPLTGSSFVIRNREQYPVNDYISLNRRQFYKIFHMSSGTGILSIGLHQYQMNAGEIAFLHPDGIMSWQTTSEATGGHFCLIHPDYLEHDPQLLQLFRNYPYFVPSRAVVQLSSGQSLKINDHFTTMAIEENGQEEDKKEAILLQLQMILLEARRAGKNLANTAVPDNYRYIHEFLSLLEDNFQVHTPEQVVKMRTASEFAEQLHLHPNYLNALVKNHTGKTLREHIQDRLLYEAKSLLLQTDWDINLIGYALGFSEHAAFTAFFNKKERVSPSRFRKMALEQAHL